MREEIIDDLEAPVRPRPLLGELPLLRENFDPIAFFLILIAGAAVLIMALKLRLFPLWIEFLNSNAFLRVSTYPLLISAVIILAGLIFQTYFWTRYKPLTPRPGESVDWPFVSVIMPALNEEELVGKSIDSIFAADYPADRLEVVCVNDGSTDMTYYHMLRARQKYGNRVKVIHFRKNLGKRHAFYAGLKKSRGEIIVSVDTDSRIGRSALKNIVLPLIRDERTGAVAGRVAALNEKDNLLTRMLAIRYSISFDFGRAYQSVFGTVLVCPGALTAYRRSLLMKFIRGWLNQTFWGAPCKHGEDRALTNEILKLGYFTRYQSNAVVYTQIPPRIRQMNRMYLRWTRSYVRETILFARFMFTKYRKEHRLLPIFDFIILNLLHPFHLLAVAVIAYSFVVNPLFIIRHLAFLVATSFVLSLYNLRTNRSLSFLYGVPYAMVTAFLLWWIVPYSFLTLRNQSWLTR
jgi:hyaluronan synthase